MLLKNKILLLSATFVSLFTTYVVNADDVTNFVPIESNVSGNKSSDIENFVKVDESQLSYNESYDSIYNNQSLDGMNSEKPLESNVNMNYVLESSKKIAYTNSVSSVRDYAYQNVQTNQSSHNVSNDIDSKVDKTFVNNSEKVSDVTNEKSEIVDKTESKSEKPKGVLKSIGKLTSLENVKKPIGKITKLQHDLPATAIMNTKYGIVTSLVLLVSGLVSLLYGYFRKYMDQ